jgi:RimJ/RimL family protein N-acetyltransferase
MGSYEIGPPVPRPAGLMPDGGPLKGRYVDLEHVEVGRHGADLWDSFQAGDPEGRIWTYLGYGPFTDRAAFLAWLTERQASSDPLFYAIVPRRTGKASGMASFMRMTPDHGVIEIGHIWFSPGLQNTREATEALYLMMRHVLATLKCRRLEWKCDALNQPSRAAAERLGFIFEGVFRQHMIVKGRNRDTAWYAMLDRDWPAIDAAFRRWLAADNFDSAGRQRQALQAAEAGGIKRASTPQPG